MSSTYITQPGESLMGIALRQLGDMHRWEEISDANAARFPDMDPHDYYPVGTELIMPGATPPAAQVQGEQPDVMAWADPSDLNLMHRHGHTSCVVKAVQAPCFSEPLMLVSQHERVVAGLQGEVSNLKGLLRYFDEHGATQAWVMRYKQVLEGAALSASPAAGVPWVMGLLDTGDWRLTRIRPNEAMTDEFNRRHSWEVERQMPPYSRDRGLRSWFGETPEQAFTEAINDLFPGRLREFLVTAPTPPASEQQQAVEAPEPFMFVKLHAGDVMDWTQDPSLAEYWAEEGDTVAELYSGHDLRLNPHLQPAAPSQGE